MAFPITPLTTDLKVVEFPGTGELEVTDQKLRDITIYYEDVTSVATCPSIFMYEGTQGTLAASAADEHAIYRVLCSKIGYPSTTNQKYVEAIVVSGAWELLGEAPTVLETEALVYDSTSTVMMPYVDTSSTTFYDADTLSYQFSPIPVYTKTGGLIDTSVYTS